MNLRVAVLTDGKDPDEVIRQAPEKWEELVRNGVPLFDYLLPALSAQIDTATAEGKVRMVERVSPFIYAVNEPILQDSYVRKLSDYLSVREESLRATLNRPNMQQRASRPGNGARASGQSGDNRPSDRNGLDRSALLAEERDPLDEHCLALLLRYPDLAIDLPMYGGLPPEYFRRPENREIYLQLTTAWSEAPEMLMPEESLAEQAKRSLAPELWGHLERLVSRNLPPMEPWERQEGLRQILARLEQRQLKELKLAEQVRFSEDLSEITEEIFDDVLVNNRRIKANEESRRQYSQKATRGR